MQYTKQSFSTTTDTSTSDGVSGIAIRYEMTATGTFQAITAADLDYTAWDALTDDERAAVCSDVRTGGFDGFFRKQEG